MKNLLLLVIILSFGCTKIPITEELIKSKPTSVNVKITFIKNADESLEKYKIYFQIPKKQYICNKTS